MDSFGGSGLRGASRLCPVDETEATIYPDTLTVGPSPLKVLGSVAIATVAITGGLTILVVLLELLAAARLLGVLPMPAWVWSSRWTIVAWAAALVACYRGVAVLGAVIWARPRIEIGPDGFADYGVLGHRSRRWGDIVGGFTVIRVGWPFAVGRQRVVAYRLTHAFKEAARIKPVALLGGYDEAILICGELAIGAGELAEVLNQWKQGVTGVPPSA